MSAPFLFLVLRKTQVRIINFVHPKESQGLMKIPTRSVHERAVRRADACGAPRRTLVANSTNQIAKVKRAGEIWRLMTRLLRSASSHPAANLGGTREDPSDLAWVRVLRGGGTCLRSNLETTIPGNDQRGSACAENFAGQLRYQGGVGCLHQSAPDEYIEAQFVAGR